MIPGLPKSASNASLLLEQNAQLYGNNLDKVNSIVIGGKKQQPISLTQKIGENSYIEYTVPEGLADGTYRIILVDNGGNEYGGNKVTVTSDALITAGSERTTANSEWVMTGINLNQIESFTFGGQTISSFIRQSETEIAFTCPSLEDGEYTLTGRTTSGKEVMFYTTAGNITEQTVVVSSERVLWEGHHYVSWDLPDDNPNKTFNLIGKDVFASIKGRSRIKHILFSKLCRRISPVAHHNRLVERSARYCRHRIPGRRSKSKFN